jgi:hypothetical protein
VRTESGLKIQQFWRQAVDRLHKAQRDVVMFPGHLQMVQGAEVGWMDIVEHAPGRVTRMSALAHMLVGGRAVSNQNQWPAVVVAVAFLVVVGAILVSVVFHDGVDGGLKIWGGIGALVGVIAGAIPSYFFHQEAVAQQRNANALRLAADPNTIEKAKQYGLRVGE